MIKKVNNFLTRRFNKKRKIVVEKRLAEIVDTAKSRLSRCAIKRDYRDLFDYLDSSEIEEYSVLSEEHWILSGGHSSYLKPSLSPSAISSPKASLTVSLDNSSKVEMQYDEDGLIYFLRDGEKINPYHVEPSNFFGQDPESFKLNQELYLEEKRTNE